MRHRPSPALPAGLLRGARWLTIAASIAAGCGGARTEADLNAAFARIQVEEARIEAAATPRERECAEESADCAQIAEAAGALCTIARDIDDRDALHRCDRASGRHQACRAAHHARCTVPSGPAGAP
jgi:hypothetical protein